MFTLFFSFAPAPVLAAPIQGMVAAVLMIIAFIGWIVNLINSQNHPPPPARRRRPNNDPNRSMQDEIDQFLSEARQARQGRRPRPAGGDARSRNEIEVVGPGASRRPPQQARKSREEIWREQTGSPRRKSPPASSSPPPKAQAAPQPSRPGESIASRHVTTSVKEGEMAAQVQQRMASRLATRVEQTVPHTVESAVASHLGQFSAELATSSGMQAYAQTKRRESRSLMSLRQMLQRKEGVRNAIIANEILMPPLSRRRK